MLKRNKKGIYEFQRFKKFKGLIHGISTRRFGDCRTNQEKFLKALGLKKENLVLAEQVHGNKVKIVGETSKGKTIPEVDGLISDTPGVILGVRTADCLPMLFYEPRANIIGICHAGWKGIIARLPQKMIDLLIKKGGLPGEILVAIGPFIGGCCYNIKEDRAQQFEAVFGKLKKMITRHDNQLMLDLTIPAKVQLTHSGVLEKNIEFGSFCTSCSSQDFFSYRKDKKETYGEILSVISLKV